jgi:hypothetical protein
MATALTRWQFSQGVFARMTGKSIIRPIVGAIQQYAYQRASPSRPAQARGEVAIWLPFVRYCSLPSRRSFAFLVMCPALFQKVVMEASGNRQEICPGRFVSPIWTGAASASFGGAGVWRR